MSRFTSAFAPKMEAMLENRIARGLKESAHFRSLKLLDTFCAVRYPQSNELTAEIAHAWLQAETATSTNGLLQKASSIRQLGKYLNAVGEEAYVLPEKFAPQRKNFAPYIFSDSELSKLFAEIDRLGQDRTEPFLHVIAPVLFRLIYTCGLRPGEGRELLRENIDLDAGELLLKETKRSRDRIIVMSDDMATLCKEYDERRNIIGGSSPYFFPATNGGSFSSAKLSATLNKAWTLATCTPHNPISRRVRIYDLRHRFASACLNRWLDEGRDLMVMLPYLRSYMGHDSIDETAYYIHILPENLAKSPAVDWKKFNDMFPEVDL